MLGNKKIDNDYEQPKGSLGVEIWRDLAFLESSLKLYLILLDQREM